MALGLGQFKASIQPLYLFIFKTLSYDKARRGLAIIQCHIKYDIFFTTLYRFISVQLSVHNGSRNVVQTAAAMEAFKV